jgi:hypothetical protein
MNLDFFVFENIEKLFSDNKIKSELRVLYSFTRSSYSATLSSKNFYRAGDCRIVSSEHDSTCAAVSRLNRSLLSKNPYDDNEDILWEKSDLDFRMRDYRKFGMCVTKLGTGDFYTALILDLSPFRDGREILSVETPTFSQGVHVMSSLRFPKSTLDDVVSMELIRRHNT